jgi:hypothetical protein
VLNLIELQLELTSKKNIVKKMSELDEKQTSSGESVG